MSDDNTVEVSVSWEVYYNPMEDIRTVEVPEEVARDPEKLKNWLRDYVSDELDYYERVIKLTSIRDGWTNEDLSATGWQGPPEEKTKTKDE